MTAAARFHYTSEMSAFDYPILAREGRAHLLGALACGVIATWLFGYWSLIVWAAIVLVFQFFRDPKRRITSQPGAVVSPASGKIVALGEAENPYLKGKSLKVSIFMSVFSVHSNLIPVGGAIMRCWRQPGKFFNAALDKSSRDNERSAIWIQTARGDDIVCVQIAGLLARRILSYVKPGDSVQTGQRYGFIRFGSRVDLYLPPHAQLVVRLGQRVCSGNNIIGFIKESSAETAARAGGAAGNG
ncbi:MAG: phosphatidylserine decarboxylase [Gammaproteobacteria bacterium]|nr:phosphatidylserine decarboxylase [Gammaproteobacteria bacterium]MDA8011063.1 phosphatidylserine decarboxylase [Gammaproteobacteria bacterium]MDA8021581.1 phosphatidylserine decarboxylase [Gammaproteobacteria bacterium]